MLEFRLTNDSTKVCACRERLSFLSRGAILRLPLITISLYLPRLPLFLWDAQPASLLCHSGRPLLISLCRPLRCLLLLPAHQIARRRKEHRVDNEPDYENTDVETYARV